MDGLNRLVELEKRLELLKRAGGMVVSVPRNLIIDRTNPMESLDDVKFQLRFHIGKDTVKFILGLIEEDLQHSLKRQFHIPPILQLLYALRFFTTGAFQLAVGDIFSVAQSSMSRTILRVATAIAKRSKLFIKYPSFSEASKEARKFQEIGGFPGVVGCIDGTHIPIPSPGGDSAEMFRNRKGSFSINVQAIGNSNLEFTDIVARWYGSAHDSRIFDNSVIKDSLENKLVPGLLLGDSGYACTPYLMTPLRSPGTPSEKKYNVAQKKTRNSVERMFGVWKKRFPCLNYLRTKLGTSLIVIVAVAVLHNICRKRNDACDEDDCEEYDEEEGGYQATTSGRAARAQLIARKF